MTTALPLAFVLIVTGVKDAFDDYVGVVEHIFYLKISATLTRDQVIFLVYFATDVMFMSTFLAHPPIYLHAHPGSPQERSHD